MDATGGRPVLDGLASLWVLVVMRDGQGCSSLTLLPMQRSSRQDRVLSGSNGDERQSSGQASKKANSEAGGARVRCYWGRRSKSQKAGAVSKGINALSKKALSSSCLVVLGR